MSFCYPNQKHAGKVRKYFILHLQSQISKVFLDHMNIFSHSRSEQFWRQNTISCLDRKFLTLHLKKFHLIGYVQFLAHKLKLQNRFIQQGRPYLVKLQWKEKHCQFSNWTSTIAKERWYQRDSREEMQGSLSSSKGEKI